MSLVTAQMTRSALPDPFRDPQTDHVTFALDSAVQGPQIVELDMATWTRLGQPTVLDVQISAVPNR